MNVIVKKLSLFCISTVVCISMLFCISLAKRTTKSGYTVTIQTDRTSYEITSSAVQGITMIPNLKADNDNTKIQYHWIATHGILINTKDNSAKSEIINSGEPVLWSAVSNMESSPPVNATVTLKIENKKTGAELAKTNLSFYAKGATYIIAN